MCAVDLLDRAGRQPRLDGRPEVGRRTLGGAEQRVRHAPGEQRDRDPRAPGRELLERPVGVGERLLHAVGHHVRAQGGDPGLDRGAAVGERDRRGGPVRDREPPLGLGGTAGQHPEPPAVDRERRVACQLLRAEPPQPLLRRVHAAVVVVRQGEGIDQAGERLRLTGGVRVADRRLRVPVGDAPLHRAAVEDRHHLRLAPLELVAQQLAEQVVIAVPLAPPVERHDEAVRPRERLERARRPRRLQDGVAEPAAHALEDGGVLQEPRLGRREPREELEAEVLGHEAVVAREARGAGRGRPSRLQGQRREVQAGGPALGPLGQLARVEPGVHGGQHGFGLLLVQPQLRHADLLHQPPRPPARQRERGLLPARDRELRARREVADQPREPVQAGGIGHGMEVVEHEHQRPLERSQGVPDARDPLRPARASRPGKRLEDIGRQRLDPVQRSRDVAQEHHGVVVGGVERDPRERTRIGLGPVGQQRRLAVPGGRDHGHDRRARRPQPLDQRRLRHRSRPGQRRSKLDLHEVEGNVRHGQRAIHPA